MEKPQAFKTDKPTSLKHDTLKINYIKINTDLFHLTGTSFNLSAYKSEH